MNLEPTLKIPEICWKHGGKKQPQRFISVKKTPQLFTGLHIGSRAPKIIILSGVAPQSSSEFLSLLTFSHFHWTNRWRLKRLRSWTTLIRALLRRSCPVKIWSWTGSYRCATGGSVNTTRRMMTTATSAIKVGVQHRLCTGPPRKGVVTLNECECASDMANKWVLRKSNAAFTQTDGTHQRRFPLRLLT